MYWIIRPISLLTSFSNIFEKVIYNRLYHHIKHNHILADEQFGFKYGSSTDIASYHLTNNILTALNNKLLVGGIFCDLQKAFNSVSYDVLLSKMEFYGISWKAYNLINHIYYKDIKGYLFTSIQKNITLNGNWLLTDFLKDPYLDLCCFCYMLTIYQMQYLIYPTPFFMLMIPIW
jgi:hypothetical protein